MKKQKVKSSHIETLDGGGSFNFFTEATNHKEALERLLTSSYDYKNVVSSNNNLTIIIKKLLIRENSRPSATNT